MLILEALLAESTQLERLVLVDGGTGNLPGWSHPPEFADFLVGFVATMPTLSCFCVTFNQMDIFLAKDITQRVTEEVVGMRLSLWFHLDRAVPKASDPGVPPIHYHQIVEPISFDMPHF